MLNPLDPARKALIFLAIVFVGATGCQSKISARKSGAVNPAASPSENPVPSVSTFTLEVASRTIVGDAVEVTWSNGGEGWSYQVTLARASDCSDPAAEVRVSAATAATLRAPSAGEFFVCAYAMQGEQRIAANNNGIAVSIQSPAATLALKGTSEVNLGTMVQGSTRDVRLDLSYAGNVPITKLNLTPIPGLNYRGGSFPGTDGTCSSVVAGDCSLVLSAEAGLEIGSRAVTVTLSYESVAGQSAVITGLSGTTKFLYGASNFVDPSRASTAYDGGGGVWTNGTKLLITSPYSNRVMGWHNLPTSIRQPPDFVLGAAGVAPFGNGKANASECRYPIDVSSDGTHIAVVCYAQNRVLIWNNWPAGNGAPASAVVGQTDFSGVGANAGGITGATLNTPIGVAIRDGRLYVADTSNNRVLVFSSIPSINGATADRVIGQVDFTSSAAATSAVGLYSPFHVAVDSNRLFVADTSNHRVLSYPSAYPDSGSAADIVVGHSLMTQGAVNDGGPVAADVLNNPANVGVDDGALFVADRDNKRVVRFPLPLTGNKPNAVQVYGQQDLVSVIDDDGAVTAHTLDRPVGVGVGGGKLIAADDNNRRISIFDTGATGHFPQALIWGQQSSTNEDIWGQEESRTHCQHPFPIRTATKFFLACYYSNRILGWNHLPASPNEPADFVLGQSDFGSTQPNSGAAVNSGSFHYPYEMVEDASGFWVVDQGNHRILRYPSAPGSGAEVADLTLGQPNLTSGSPNGGGAANAGTLYNPTSIAVAGGRFFVADYSNNRVLIFNAVPTASGAPASVVLGQADMNSTQANRGGAPAANTLSGPLAVWSDGTRMAISDSENHRILLWHEIPVVSGAPAEVVLGQADFNAFQSNRGGSEAIRGGLKGPQNIITYGSKFIVADRYNNRILVWNSWPSASGLEPDSVLMQPGFTTSDRGLAEDRLSDIVAVSIFGGTLFVADRANFRVLGLPMQ